MKRKSLNEADIKQQIVERIYDGQPLRAVCREAGMPSFRTVYYWLDNDADFAKQMQKARETGFEAIAEDCLIIADDTLPDSDEVARNKLRIHVRLQLLSKWSPKYSDKQQVTLSADASIAQAILAARQRLRHE